MVFEASDRLICDQDSAVTCNSALFSILPLAIGVKRSLDRHLVGHYLSYLVVSNILCQVLYANFPIIHSILSKPRYIDAIYTTFFSLDSRTNVQINILVIISSRRKKKIWKVLVKTRKDLFIHTKTRGWNEIYYCFIDLIFTKMNLWINF